MTTTTQKLQVATDALEWIASSAAEAFAILAAPSTEQPTATVGALPQDAASKLLFDAACECSNPEQIDAVVHILTCDPDFSRRLVNCINKRQAAPAGDAEELHFNAQRLRNVLALAGVSDPFPDSDASSVASMGATLGQVATVLRERAATQPERDEKKFTQADMERFAKHCMDAREERLAVPISEDTGECECRFPMCKSKAGN